MVSALSSQLCGLFATWGGITLLKCGFSASLASLYPHFMIQAGWRPSQLHELLAVVTCPWGQSWSYSQLSGA